MSANTIKESGIIPAVSRRDFLKNSSSAALGAAVLGGLSIERSAYAADSSQLKICLVGCGGRGTGAAGQALSTAGDVKLVAIADVRPEQIEKSLGELKKLEIADRVDVPPDRQFTDFEGYKKAISLCDVAILATSPGFRPVHFEEAVRQGKHIFMEKPVATDAPGIRRVLAAAEEAKKKNLKVGVGLQRHHKPGYIETIKRIQDGALGDIVYLRAYWDGSSRDGVERKEGESELHYQIRNWYYFTYLSGDHIVEQHVHNIDVANWIKGTHPVRAQGMGGRQVRNALRHGQIYDHHFVEFEYADGTRMMSQCRQIPHCWPSVSEHAHGTKGEADLVNDSNIFTIRGANHWKYTKKDKDPYQIEHDDLFAAIRNDTPYNEAVTGAQATMTGILGRMCTYSGKKIEWDEAFKSDKILIPDITSWDSKPPVMPDSEGRYPVAMPGITEVI
jgi:myo-inositol 2-dehydrogenase/D-chiro-inositol 1-dehydrogenase